MFELQPNTTGSASSHKFFSINKIQTGDNTYLPLFTEINQSTTFSLNRCLVLRLAAKLVEIYFSFFKLSIKKVIFYEKPSQNILNGRLEGKMRGSGRRK
jgi:hypothetical protein